MKTDSRAERRACPVCHHPLLPVHAVEGMRRRVLYLTCPEPYCGYAEEPEGPLAGQIRMRVTAQRPPLVEDC